MGIREWWRYERLVAHNAIKETWATLRSGWGIAPIVAGVGVFLRDWALRDWAFAIRAFADSVGAGVAAGGAAVLLIGLWKAAFAPARLHHAAAVRIAELSGDDEDQGAIDRLAQQAGLGRFFQEMRIPGQTQADWEHGVTDWMATTEKILKEHFTWADFTRFSHLGTLPSVDPPQAINARHADWLRHLIARTTILEDIVNTRLVARLNSGKPMRSMMHTKLP